MNLNPSTMLKVVSDLVESLEQSGIRKLLLLNSHGGNDLKPLLRELYGRSQVHLFLCNWYQMIADVYSRIFEQRDDHAGKWRPRSFWHFVPTSWPGKRMERWSPTKDRRAAAVWTWRCKAGDATSRSASPFPADRAASVLEDWDRHHVRQLRGPVLDLEHGVHVVQDLDRARRFKDGAPFTCPEDNARTTGGAKVDRGGDGEILRH